MTTLTLFRTGRLYSKGNSTLCFRKNHGRFQFDIRLTCKAVIDQHGYLIEHEDIQRAVQEHEFTGTCETFHLQLLDIVEELLYLNGISHLLLKYEATIYPVNTDHEIHQHMKAHLTLTKTYNE